MRLYAGSTRRDPVMKLTEREFRKLVEKALKRLPEEIACHLKEVTITVRACATEEQDKEIEGSDREPLLGLYEGIPLNERSVFDGSRPPDIVYLFQEPLEEMCDSLEELEEEIEITIAHELGHYIGLSEDRLAELGYA